MSKTVKIKGKTDKISVPLSTFLDMSEIIPPRIAMRADIEGQSLQQLADSIKDLGLICPICVMKTGDKFEIVAGNRRFEAYRLLEKKQIHCVVIEQNSEMYFRTMTAENYERQDIGIIDEVAFIEKLNVELQLSQTQIAKYINKSVSYVNERIAVLSYPEPLVIALVAGDITFSVAREFYKITDANVCETYLKYAVENGCTPAIARKWRKQWELQKEQPEKDFTADTIDNWEASQQKPHSVMSCAICREEYELQQLITLYICHNCNKSIINN